MAGNIKGITIEFRGDTTKLDKALRQINNETKAIDKELKLVDKALKFNPTSVDLWRQKQQLLTQKVNETKEKLELLKAEQARMDAEGVDKNSEEYRKLQREIITTESQVKTFEAQLRKIGNVNLRATSEQFKEIGNKLTSAGQAMREFSMAGAAVVGVLGTMAVKAGKTADDLNTMSKVYGISTQDLQKYKLAAEQVDVPVEAIAKSHVKLEKQMYSAKDGTGSAADAFKALGVEVTNADGSLKSGDAVWQDTIAALGQMENETERDAIAMQLMGKSASELNPLIEDGGETYKRVADLFKKYNLDLVDQETLDKANEFNDKLDDIKSMGSLAFEMLGAKLAGYLLPVMGKVVNVVGKFVGWLAQLNPKVLAVIGVVAGVVAAIAPVLLILGKLSFAISSILGLMSTLGVSFAALAGPVGIVIAIIAALIAAGVLLYKHWDEIKAYATALGEHIKTTFDTLKTNIINIWNSIKTFLTTIWNGIKTLAKVAWEGIKLAALGPVVALVSAVKSNWSSIKTATSNAWNAVKSATSSAWNAIKDAMTAPIQKAKDTIMGIIDKVKSKFPVKLGNIFSFKLPHISVGSKTVKVGDKDVKVPTFSVNWYAKGGIFDGAQVVGVGEKGPEAVVPLDKFWQKLDNIAAASAASHGEIVININGANKDPQQIALEVKRILIKETNKRRVAWQ